MYELMRVLITVLMMIYVYRILDESIHCKTLNPEQVYCVMLNLGWLHSFQKPFVYNIIIIINFVNFYIHQTLGFNNSTTVVVYFRREF